MRLSKTTVIYGGSFDPPHLAHQLTCLWLLEALDAQTVLLIPTFAHAFAKPLTAFAHRLAMCELLAAPLGPRLEVSRIEESLGGVSRTWDTLEALRAARPTEKFALAIGADILGETHAWYRWADLEATLPIVVIGRGGVTARADTPPLPAISSTEIRGRAARKESLEGWVPSRVADYIEQHGLYRGVA